MGIRRDALKRADHIYTNCSGRAYYHHGIYVGKAKVTNPIINEEQREIDDAVIHFLGISKKSGYKPQCKNCFHTPNNLGVVITCLDCFLEGNSLYVYEYDVSFLTFSFKKSGSCSTHACYGHDHVIKTAFDILNKKQHFGQYNLLFNNCEHFATYCKTGSPMCNQVLYGTGLPGAIAYNVAREVLYWD